MEFMLDTVNLDEIKKWSRVLPLAGVTSNPTIVKKEGTINFFERIQEIREVIGTSASIHIQVVAKDYEGILRDARKIRREFGDDIYIKIPVTTDGLAAIKVLKEEGVRITATAIYTTFQGLLAIETGADYLAPYYNRMENLNINPEEVLSLLAQAIARSGSSSKILAASFKNVAQMNRAFACGVQAITAGSEVFEAAFAMPAISKAVDDFAKDWQEAQGKLHI
ncbi:fructose-6-phosphate aldolase [Streptococcus sp. 19428wC2_LYSM12]|uniref:fructose-6-phosphate aldolase n=1 Tax=unclassified Streptococcus TaxID=2608887 RepID=UPI001072D2F2|nr:MULTISPECIES: fructose-6-phosphate aldolase [unclassified Streptococcus]MBF0788070.1 fructose-6-phosphate aldolase [Streptococcus sp. 19428wC2_LYSM12]MCQ9214702.1 fructose-6-phosphate aldolase [Streptococcus sp. O1]TFV04883.1 fructose-6-phosphate aldolase [Streptococcus sp. LYSM12]